MLLDWLWHFCQVVEADLGLNTGSHSWELDDLGLDTGSHSWELDDLGLNTGSHSWELDDFVKLCDRSEPQFCHL